MKLRTSRMFQPDTLLASVAVLLVVNLVQRSVGFGRGLLYCRWLEPEGLGNWEMAYGFLLLAAPLAVLGLPGSFGRYLERFRQRGQLRMFMRRAVAWTAAFSLLTAGLLVALREPFAYLVFGTQQQASLMVLVAAVLLCVILHHFLEAVFAGLRVFRVVSCMQFAHSLLFAAISLSLLTWYRRDATSIALGYGAACLISSVGVLLWSRSVAYEPAPDSPDTSHREFWPPLLRFAVWVWVTNLLCNLFAVIDRYMIIHCSGLPATESLALVGNYHTSMLLPALLVSVANLLVGAMTPHLSCDWEAGRPQHVSRRLNLIFTFTSMGMLVAGIAVLIVTPPLFHCMFGSKYDSGLAVLPWALVGCVWFALLLVAQIYVWCAEKTRQATIPLAVGLGMNVVLNLLLLPRLGLLGALMATGLATGMAIVVQLVVNQRLGMSISRGTMIATALPLSLAFGLSVALPLFVVLLIACVGTRLVFERHEQLLIGRTLARLWPGGMVLAANSSRSEPAL
jgi:polysaccharide transporter, PST family